MQPFADIHHKHTHTLVHLLVSTSLSHKLGVTLWKFQALFAMFVVKSHHVSTSRKLLWLQSIVANIPRSVPLYHIVAIKLPDLRLTKFGYIHVALQPIPFVFLT